LPPDNSQLLAQLARTRTKTKTNSWRRADPCPKDSQGQHRFFPWSNACQGKKEITSMARKLLLFVVVLTLSSWVAAQEGNKSGAVKSAVTPADTTCAHTFHSGSNWTETQYCVTANGNITQFSNPAGSDNIAGVWPSEGYGIL
jgi:hypothetical protein